MKIIITTKFFLASLALLTFAGFSIIGFPSFATSEEQEVSAQADSGSSVELGILEFSPKGEAGGYAMPASGCSTTHTNCIRTESGYEGDLFCAEYETFVHECVTENINLGINHNAPADNIVLNTDTIYSFTTRVRNNGSGRFDGDDEFKSRVDWAWDETSCSNPTRDAGNLIHHTTGVIEVAESQNRSITKFFGNNRVGTHCYRYRISDIKGFTDPNLSNNITSTWRKFSVVAPINGSCGTANGRTFSHTDTSYGSYTACTVGDASGFAFPAAGSSDSWTCGGSNGGEPASCSASRSAVPADDDLTPDEPTINGVIPTTVNTRIPIGTAASLYTVQRNIGNANSATYRLRFYVDQPVSSAINAGGIFDNQGALAPNGNRPHSRTWTPTETGVHAIRVETENSGTWTQYNQDTDLEANNDDSSTYSFWVIPQPVDDLTYICSADGSQIDFNWTAPAGTVGNRFAWRFDNVTQGGWTNTCSSINPGDECLEITGTSRTVNISPGDSVSAWVHARGNDNVWGASGSTGTFTCGQSDLDPNNPLFNGSNPNGQDYRIGTPITISSIQQNKGGVTSGQYRFRFLVDQPTSADIAPGGNFDGQGPILAGGTNSHSTTWTPTELGAHTVSAQTFANGSFGTYIDSDTSNNNSAALSFNIVPVPECIDGSDNDNDGLIDSADPDCPGGGVDGCSSPPCNEDTNDTPVDASIEVCLLGDTGGSSCTPDTLSIVGVDEVEISWDSTFASNCTFTNFNGGGLTGSASRNGTDITIVEPSDSSRTYTVTCIDSSDGTSISDSVIVSHAASGSTDACVPPYDISADPRVVRSGTNSTISFTNYNEATGCTLHQNDITNPAVSTSGTRSCGVSTTYTAGPLTSASTYVLNCPGDPGPTRPTVTIPVIPVIDDN